MTAEYFLVRIVALILLSMAAGCVLTLLVLYMTSREGKPTEALDRMPDDVAMSISNAFVDEYLKRDAGGRT